MISCMILTFTCVLSRDVARLINCLGSAGPLTAFNRVFNCYIRVYRSFSIFIGRAYPTFGWAWALPGPPLATPLVLRLHYIIHGCNVLQLTACICMHVQIWLAAELYSSSGVQLIARYIHQFQTVVQPKAHLAEPRPSQMLALTCLLVYKNIDVMMLYIL